MEIIKTENNTFQLEYTYKIIVNRASTKDGIYYFYTTQFSCEIVRYFGTTNYWIYEYDNHIYLTTEEPTDYNCKKIKARDKYNKGKIRVIPVNAKMFNLVGDIKTKYLKIILYLDKKDFVSDDILVELKVVE